MKKKKSKDINSNNIKISPKMKTKVDYWHFIKPNKM